MRKYLLPEKGNFYKANLHSHSTESDGGLTPEQMKKVYMDHGYSIIAYTDHNVFLRHNDLTDENFLALNGYEVDIDDEDDPRPYFMKKTCHLCFIALSPDTEIQVAWHRSKYCSKGALLNMPRVKFDESLPDYVRNYTPECINDMIKKAKEGGFYVTYNHPSWSMEQYPDYIKYTGMDALEIVNFTSIRNGFDEYNYQAYNDLLLAGNRIAAVYADDNHTQNPEHPMTDLCGGFVMIKADKLEYTTITDAMKRGDYYASLGPEIKDAYIEDGKLYVKTSPVRQITLNYGYRAKSTKRVHRTDTLEEAVFDIKQDVAAAKDSYFRITLTDGIGLRADSRAYFFDEDGMAEALKLPEEK